MNSEKKRLHTLGHISGYLSLLSDYELEKVLIKVNKEIIHKKLGVYIDANDYWEGKIYNTSIPVDLRIINDDALIKNVKDIIETRFESLENYFLFSKNHSLINTHSFYHECAYRFHISNGHTSCLRDLVYFFRYIINGKFDEDLKETHDILDKYKPLWYDIGHFSWKSAFDITFSELGIRVHKFQNGRLDIHCSDEILKKIISTLELIKKLR